jgi:PAS domain S-box-containing protein
MPDSLRILLLEDNAADAEIIQDIVSEGRDCLFYVAADREHFLAGLTEFKPTLILSDNSLPQFDSEEALDICRQHNPDIPFILVTGTVSEEYAVKITKKGADDYILKDRLARLPAAIDAALQHRHAELQKKQAAFRLIESEEKYRTLVGRITDAFIALDANWNYTYLNRQAGILLHKEIEDILGKNVWEVFSDAVGSITYRAYHEAMRTQQFICAADYYAPLDLWLESHIYPSAEGLSIFIRDITEAKKAAQQLAETSSQNRLLAGRLAAILNTIPASIALLDSTGVIIDVNDAWKAFSTQPGVELQGYGMGTNYVNICQLTEGEDAADAHAVAEGLQRVLKNQLREFVFEYCCPTPAGNKWFRMIATPLEEKAFSGAVVMHLDISEIRQLEQDRMTNKIIEQRKITRAILTAQEKERNLIGSELHDNVNQILAGIKLVLSTARLQPANNSSIIENAINNVQFAIDENRKLAHELVAPDFKEIKIAEQLHVLAEGMLRKAGMEVHLDTRGFEEEGIDDEQKLAIYRIAQEQCTNIVKHAAARAVHITLSQESGMISMTIKDNGKGMEKGRQARGIGFRNIRSRADLFNGTVQTDTAPGQGFCMTVRMPLQPLQPALL